MAKVDSRVVNDAIKAAIMKIPALVNQANPQDIRFQLFRRVSRDLEQMTGQVNEADLQKIADNHACELGSRYTGYSPMSRPFSATHDFLMENEPEDFSERTVNYGPDYGKKNIEDPRELILSLGIDYDKLHLYHEQQKRGVAEGEIAIKKEDVFTSHDNTTKKIQRPEAVNEDLPPEDMDRSLNLAKVSTKTPLPKSHPNLDQNISLDQGISASQKITEDQLNTGKPNPTEPLNQSKAKSRIKQVTSDKETKNKNPTKKARRKNIDQNHQEIDESKKIITTQLNLVPRVEKNGPDLNMKQALKKPELPTNASKAILAALKQGMTDEGKSLPLGGNESFLLRRVRIRSGMDHDQFAKKLGVPKSTLKAWEYGAREPSGAARVLIRMLSDYPYLLNLI